MCPHDKEKRQKEPKDVFAKCPLWSLPNKSPFRGSTYLIAVKARPKSLLHTIGLHTLAKYLVKVLVV